MGFILPLSMVDTQTHSLLEAVERAATPTNSNQIRKIVSNTNNAFITYIFPRAPKSALPCACNTCDATAPETFSTNTHTYRTKLLFKQNNPILLWFRYESKKESSCLLHLICIDLFIICRAGIHMQSGANSFRSHSIWMCVCVLMLMLMLEVRAITSTNHMRTRPTAFISHQSFSFLFGEFAHNSEGEHRSLCGHLLLLRGKSLFIISVSQRCSTMDVRKGITKQTQKKISKIFSHFFLCVRLFANRYRSWAKKKKMNWGKNCVFAIKSQ